MGLFCTCQSTFGISLERLRQLLLLSATIFCGLHGALLVLRVFGDNHETNAAIANNLREFTGANATDTTAKDSGHKDEVVRFAMPSFTARKCHDHHVPCALQDADTLMRVISNAFACMGNAAGIVGVRGHGNDWSPHSTSVLAFRAVRG